ncbi:hypothetical protein VTO42DRAFT_6145 [Malbranchea cinnamomea]
MGIPMDDINAPTVPSGPTSARAEGPDLSKLTLHELFQEKDRLEAELKALASVLRSHGVTMTTPLTTFDGYPRDDIDVAQIRHTRARIIYLRNDYKAVMAKVEEGIHARFASLQEAERARADATRQSPVPAEIMEAEPPSSGLVEAPFARVNSVAPGSPAAQAGLKTGDKVRNFGGINWMNHENLTKIAQVVQQNEGRVVQVKITRPNESGQGATDLSLQLTPRRNWGGRGLLGCHLVPL